MTQEEKDLLVKDLCARLSYKNKIKGVLSYDKDKEIFTIEGYEIEKEILYLSNSEGCHIDDFKPYLRPMSSMTEEEKGELKEICADYLDEWENAETVVDRWKLDAKSSYNRSTFYNSHHLDWNGLIEKGLALEAPEEMYVIK